MTLKSRWFPNAASVGRALIIFLAVTPVRAQDKPQFGPEVTSVLGQPGAGPSNLDADAVAVLGQPGAAPPTEAVAAARAAALSSKLRCPVCQGVSIADSPAGLATSMRGQVRELVAKGYTDEQVLSYFERSYGEFVRLEPPVAGLNLALWILPAVVLMSGAAFVWWKARPQPVAAPLAPTDAPAESDPARNIDPELAKYLERIRRDSGTAS